MLQLAAVGLRGHRLPARVLEHLLQPVDADVILVHLILKDALFRFVSLEFELVLRIIVLIEILIYVSISDG